MVENSFDFKLERMFAEAPAMADAELFAMRIVDKLDRGWTARRLLIGVMGAAGGLVGALQLLGPRAMAELGLLTARASNYLDGRVTGEISSVLAPAGVTIDMQTIWMAGALALVAVGFGVARLMREI